MDMSSRAPHDSHLGPICSCYSNPYKYQSSVLYSRKQNIKSKTNF